jgi:uncharacterized protein YoxC
MSPELITVLNALPLHVILMIGIIVLWRDNKELRDKLDEVKTMTLHQNDQLAQIKAQTNGIATRDHTISDV